MLTLFLLPVVALAVNAWLTRGAFRHIDAGGPAVPIVLVYGTLVVMAQAVLHLIVQSADPGSVPALLFGGIVGTVFGGWLGWDEARHP